MTNVMPSQDAISGKEGSLLVHIGERRLELAQLISFQATINYIKAQVNSINRRMKGSKVIGAEGTGSLKANYNLPVFREMAREYVKNGIAPTFSVVVTNADSTSSAGTQTIHIKEISPDSTLLTMLDSETEDTLTDEFDFQFGDFDILESFQGV